mmetsp:Transcript_121087/g.342604  ORF Transcript_121087/g.342604 Transcript_121087/m.342604 type:complete len:310 (-) Transcript_121087:259-1188(-)
MLPHQLLVLRTQFRIRLHEGWNCSKPSVSSMSRDLGIHRVVPRLRLPLCGGFQAIQLRHIPAKPLHLLLRRRLDMDTLKCLKRLTFQALGRAEPVPVMRRRVLAYLLVGRCVPSEKHFPLGILQRLPSASELLPLEPFRTRQQVLHLALRCHVRARLLQGPQCLALDIPGLVEPACLCRHHGRHAGGESPKRCRLSRRRCCCQRCAALLDNLSVRAGGEALRRYGRLDALHRLPANRDLHPPKPFCTRQQVLHLVSLRVLQRSDAMCCPGRLFHEALFLMDELHGCAAFPQFSIHGSLGEVHFVSNTCG